MVNIVCKEELIEIEYKLAKECPIPQDTVQDTSNISLSETSTKLKTTSSNNTNEKN